MDRSFCLPNPVSLCVGFPLAFATAVPGLIVGRRLQNSRLTRRSLLAGLSPFIYLVVFALYAIWMKSSTRDEMVGYEILKLLFPEELRNIPPPVP